MYPKNLEDLISALTILPSVGYKTAERYAMSLLNLSQNEREKLAIAITDLSKIRFCDVCGNYSTEDLCEICLSKDRDYKSICVVAYPKDIIAIEKTGVYKGRYHVLNGMISTNRNIMPDDLNIDTLIQRVNGNVDEVIVALNSSIEGETTTLYISKLLKDNVKVTRLARGISMGSNIDYIDEITISNAIKERKEI